MWPFAYCPSTLVHVLASYNAGEHIGTRRRKHFSMTQNPEQLKLQQLPPYAGLLAMGMFLAALFMLFVAGMVGYLLIRLTGPLSPPLHTLHFPIGLWISTGVILLSSVTMHHAVQAVRQDNQKPFRYLIGLTMALAVLFVVIQIPSLIILLREHRVALGESHLGEEPDLVLYGLIFALILLHALHVLGGWIPLAITTFKAQRGAYHADHWQPVRYISLYWHFLDGVWIVMFGTMVLLG